MLVDQARHQRSLGPVDHLGNAQPPGGLTQVGGDGNDAAAAQQHVLGSKRPWGKYRSGPQQ